jgi:hypothetical protein
MRGIDQPLENMGVTAEALGYPGIAENLKGAVDERPGQSASGQFMNADQDGSFAWRYLPKAGVEQAGQFAGSILSRLGGMGLGGLAGSVIPGAGTAGGALVGGLTGPMVFEAAQQLGPLALERAKNNGREVPNSEDWKYATGTSAGMGALNAIAPGLSGSLKRMLVEGATEGTQSVVEQVGSTVNTKKGLEVDPRQALAEGIIGGTSAGMVDTSVGTVRAAANLVTGGSPKSDMTEEESKAAASYAQRLIKKAEANGYDLGDVDRSAKKGAREAVDQTHVDMTTELKVLFDDLKDRIAIQDRDSVAEVSEKILAHIAYRKARNKTKNRVDQENFAAVERLTGDTQEGQRALNLMRELNQMTEIHNGGYKGGVSAVTDQFLPIGLGGEAGYDQGRAMAEYVMRPMASLYTGVATGGASTLGQLGVVGTGRAIDKVTGRRSRVQRYVDQYGNQQGQPAATGPSVREQQRAETLEEERLAAEEAARQEQMAAEQRDANLARVQQGAPPQFGSPEDIMRDGTGLDRAEIAKVLRILKANPNTLPAIRRAIEAYEQGVAVGGEMDFSLIRDINAFVEANPNYVQRNRQPNIQRAAATIQARAQQNLSQRDQNYQRGIENNRSFVNDLKEQLNADKSVRPLEKAKLLNTLNSMEYDLGADPVSALEAQAKRLYEGGVDQQAVQKYFAPYVDRVVTQQQAAQKKRQLDSRDAQVVNEPQAAMDDSREPQTTAQSKSKYKTPRRQKSGKYIGAPRGINTAGKLYRLRRYVKELATQGSYGRFWYERSGETMLAITGGNVDEAKKLVRALAITSPSTPVGTNFEYAIQAYYMWKNGQPIETGRFPESMGRKITDVFEGRDWSGRKTNNFENNLLRSIDGSLEQGVTTDLWMMRAFGYRSDAATDLNYDFVENETYKIAEELGWEPQQVQAAIWVEIKSRMESKPLKKEVDRLSEKQGNYKWVEDKKGKKIRQFKDLASEQAHGQLWVKKALAYESTALEREAAKFDYRDATLNKMAQISVESIPSTEAGHLPEIFDAPVEQIVEYHHAMDKAFLDDDGYDIVSKELGMLQLGVSNGLGSWEGRNDPVSQNEIVVPRQYRVKEDGVISEDAKDLIAAYAAVKGVLLKQKGIGWHRPFFKKSQKRTDQNGIDVNIGRPFSLAETQAISSALSQYGLEPISTATGVRFINFSDDNNNPYSGLSNYEKKKADLDFEKVIINALNSIESDNGETAQVTRFVSDNDLIENNWQENQNGEGYLNQNRLSGRPDLQRRVTDIISQLQPRVREVESEFSERYGWTPNAALNTAYDGQQSQVGSPPERPSPVPQDQGPILQQDERDISENRREGNDYSTFAVFDPKDIRSVFAKFEPSPADNRAPVLSQSDELPPKDAATETLDNFNIHYQQVPTGSIPVGLKNVTTAEEAAHVFAPIRKHAQETMLALVTDSNGKILNLIRHTKGLKNKSLVSPMELIGAVVGTENAANVWFGHNHPTGNLEPSMADTDINDQLRKTLDGTGINARGHIIVGSGGEAATFFSATAPQKSIEIKPSVRKRRQELTERVLRRRQQQNTLKVKDPSSAKKVIEQISADNALILLDNGLRVLGSLSLTQDEMQNLREGGQVNRIFKAINSTNAGAAIVKTTSKGAVSPTEPVKNLARFLNNLGADEGIRLIDWFNNGNSHGETGDTENILKSKGTFHAHPMAAIMAILTAGALQKGEEEEEEDDKMAPGALSPQPALLSA